MLTELQQKPTRIALYIRVSTEDQIERFGLDLQRTAIESYIKSRPKLYDGSDSMVVVDVYQDEWVSWQEKPEDRPEFARLKEDILSAPNWELPFDMVAVYKIDRFARRLKILLDIIEFFDSQDIKFLSVTESIDTSSPFWRAMLGIIGVIAQLELENFRERSMGGKAEAIKDGIFMWPNAPYGYIKNPEGRLEVLESEAEIIRWIYELYTDHGYSVLNIMNDLRMRDIPSPWVSAVLNKKRKGEVMKKTGASFWREKEIRKILSDEIYIGKHYFGKTKNGVMLPKEKWKPIDYCFPSIISDVVFYKATEMLENKKFVYTKARTKTTGHTYLLSGLLQCDCCYDPEKDRAQHKFIGDRKKIANGYSYYYKCGSKKFEKTDRICPTLPIPADDIEQYVIKFIRKLLNNPKAVYEYQQKKTSTKIEMKRLEKQRAEYEKLRNAIPNRKEKLQYQHEQGYINNEDLALKVKQLEEMKVSYDEELEKIRERMSRNSLDASYEETLELFGDKYTSTLECAFKNREETTKILRMLIDSITVYSRPLDENDKIAGRKKEGQHIPESIHIKLKLPQDLMNSIAREFGVKNPEWWTGRGSNPRPWA